MRDDGMCISRRFNCTIWLRQIDLAEILVSGGKEIGCGCTKCVLCFNQISDDGAALLRASITVKPKPDQSRINRKCPCLSCICGCREIAHANFGACHRFDMCGTQIVKAL